MHLVEETFLEPKLGLKKIWVRLGLVLVIINGYQWLMAQK